MLDFPQLAQHSNQLAHTLQIKNAKLQVAKLNVITGLSGLAWLIYYRHHLGIHTVCDIALKPVEKQAGFSYNGRSNKDPNNPQFSIIISTVNNNNNNTSKLNESFVYRVDEENI